MVDFGQENSKGRTCLLIDIVQIKLDLHRLRYLFCYPVNQHSGLYRSCFCRSQDQHQIGQMLPSLDLTLVKVFDMRQARQFILN